MITVIIHTVKFFVILLMVIRPRFEDLTDCLPSHIDTMILLAGEIALARSAKASLAERLVWIAVVPTIRFIERYSIPYPISAFHRSDVLDGSIAKARRRSREFEVNISADFDTMAPLG
jgi:hypothetical protein